MAADTQRGRFDLSRGVIPIGQIVVFIGATWWLSDRLHNIESRLDRIEQATLDRWTRTQMENYILKAQKTVPLLPDLDAMR